MNGLAFMIELHKRCSFQTREGRLTGKASNSEIRRWIANKAILVNGEPLLADEEMDFPIFSFVMFPKNTITLW